MKSFIESNYTIKVKLGIQPRGPVHKFLTATCMKHNDKYVPFREGTLSETVVPDIDKYTYEQIYASYVYYGMRKDGTRKIRNYTKDKHPLAGPYWADRMWTAEKDIIIKEVQDYMEGINGRT